MPLFASMVVAAMNIELNESETQQLQMLTRMRPFLLTFAAKSPEGKFVTFWGQNKRRANDYARKGWLVVQASK